MTAAPTRCFPPMRSVSQRTILAAVCILAGCGRAVADAEGDIDALPALVATPDLRIGSVEDGVAGFSQIGGVEVDRDGRIYVLETRDLQIRVYAPDGRPLHRFGRRGGGPGEFQGFVRFGVVGDTLWTYDSTAGRITLFDRTGTVLSTGSTQGLAIPLPRCYGYVLPQLMRADGLFTSEMSRVACRQDDPPTNVQPTDPIPVPRLLFDATGAIVDTLGWDPAPPPRMVPPPGASVGRFQSVTVGNRRFSVPDPPPELAHWVALADGRIVVDVPWATDASRGSFTVTRLDHAGDTVFSRSYHYTPERYDEASLDSAAARSARGAGVIGGASPPDPQQQAVIARQIRAAMDFPQFRVPIRGASALQDGSIWLLRDDGERTVARWIVLEEDGTPRGSVELPERVQQVYWSGGDAFWAVVPDEYDVPWLVRYRLTQ